MSDIESLSQEQGFIYTFAFMVYRALCYSPEEIPDIDWNERPNLREMALVLGLMAKHPLMIEYPASSEQFHSQVIRATELLEDLHNQHAFVQIFDSNEIRPQQLEKEELAELLERWAASGQRMVEPIFYGDEGAFDFQYLEMASKRYAKDGEWIERHKGLGWDVVISLAKRLKNTLDEKVNGIRLCPDFEKVLDEYLAAFSFESDDFEDISLETFSAFVRAFGLTPGTTNGHLLGVGDYNEITSHPILQLENGKCFLPLPFFLAKSIYESPFYWMNNDHDYKDVADKNRGSFFEETAEELLVQVFGARNVTRGVKVLWDGQEITDIDVLAVWGNKAVVVQSKSKMLTVDSKSGNREELKRDFKPGSTETMGCEGSLEVAEGCSRESGIMVLKQETKPKPGAPNRCYHATTLTASVSPSTTTAWWPTPD